MTSIILVDDQQLLRRGLRMLLSTQDDVTVLAELASGEGALAWLAGNEGPDVVLSDARMPGMSGMELVSRVAEVRPGLPVLILTTFDDRDVVEEAMRNGAAGFLLKDTSPESLAEAIHAAARGHIHVNWLGKVRTAVLFVALVLLVAASTWLPQFTNAGRSLLWAGAGMHALAGLGYVLEARGTRS